MRGDRHQQPPTQNQMDRDEAQRLDLLEEWEARHRGRRIGAGPRCAIPRPTPRPPAGPPIEPVTRVDNATWARWEAERQRRIDARPAPPRDARRRVCVALDAEYVDRDTASAVCPICHGVLALRFRGALVEFDCCDGCPAVDVERAVGVTS
jgi:hypothetical protein